MQSSAANSSAKEGRSKRCQVLRPVAFCKRGNLSHAFCTWPAYLVHRIDEKLINTCANEISKAGGDPSIPSMPAGPELETEWSCKDHLARLAPLLSKLSDVQPDAKKICSSSDARHPPPAAASLKAAKGDVVTPQVEHVATPSTQTAHTLETQWSCSEHLARLAPLLSELREPNSQARSSTSAGNGDSDTEPAVPQLENQWSCSEHLARLAPLLSELREPNSEAWSSTSPDIDDSETERWSSSTSSTVSRGSRSATPVRCAPLHTFVSDKLKRLAILQQRKSAASLWLRSIASPQLALCDGAVEPAAKAISAIPFMVIRRRLSRFRSRCAAVSSGASSQLAFQGQHSAPPQLALTDRLATNVQSFQRRRAPNTDENRSTSERCGLDITSEQDASARTIDNVVSMNVEARREHRVKKMMPAAQPGFGTSEGGQIQTGGVEAPSAGSSGKAKADAVRSSGKVPSVVVASNASKRKDISLKLESNEKQSAVEETTPDSLDNRPPRKRHRFKAPTAAPKSAPVTPPSDTLPCTRRKRKTRLEARAVDLMVGAASSASTAAFLNGRRNEIRFQPKDEPAVIHAGEGYFVVYKPAHWQAIGSSIFTGTWCMAPRIENWLQDNFGKQYPIFGQARVSNGMVQRLDVQTSGPMIVATNTKALASLQNVIADKTLVRKEYCALIHGVLPRSQQSGTIRYKLKPQGIRMRVHPTGAHAESKYTTATVYRREATGQMYSLLFVRIITGKKHQIRVHLAELARRAGLKRCGVVGDYQYLPRRVVNEDRSFCHGRVFLHARTLSFPPPGRKSKLRIECEMPEELQAVLENLRVVENFAGDAAHRECAEKHCQKRSRRGLAPCVGPWSSQRRSLDDDAMIEKNKWKSKRRRREY